MAARATGLTKIYGAGNTRVTALDHVDIGFEAGRLTAIMGPSGSGKSTLLHCMAGLDAVTDGETRVGDTLISELSDKELTLLRRQRLGFIFQAFNLVPTLTAEENILLPLMLGGREADPEWASQVIESLQLGDRLHHRPMSCRAASSNVSPWPGRSCRDPTSSSPTSRPATSTRRAATRCSASCGVPSTTGTRPS